MPELESVRMIWNRPQHAAFPDLLRYQNTWYCVFREADDHAGGQDGVIRLLASKDGEDWRSVALLSEAGVDLRDPKLSEAPDGRLMLLYGGTYHDAKGSYLWRQSRVCFSEDKGNTWSAAQKVLEAHDWLWKVIWHEGRAYGVSYRTKGGSGDRDDWSVSLHSSDDGVNYEKIEGFDAEGYPNETTLRFAETGTMVALLRREEPLRNDAWLGLSEAPYTQWDWYPTGVFLGGPNFLVFPDSKLWASGRMIYQDPAGEGLERTVVAALDPQGFDQELVLPSGGDTGYPGMVFHEGALWIAYYSSHGADGKTSIYLAKVKLVEQ